MVAGWNVDQPPGIWKGREIIHTYPFPQNDRVVLACWVDRRRHTGPCRRGALATLLGGRNQTTTDGEQIGAGGGGATCVCRTTRIMMLPGAAPTDERCKTTEMKEDPLVIELHFTFTARSDW